MSGQTRKPCQGCGTSGWREADKVCAKCQQLIKDGAAFRQMNEADTESGCYALPWRSYSLPYIYIGQGASEIGRDFQEKFLSLIRLIAVPVSKSAHHSSALIDGTETVEKAGLIKKEIRDLLNGCYQDVLKIADTAFNSGVEAENSMLLRLASGEVSIEQYNEATTKIK